MHSPSTSLSNTTSPGTASAPVTINFTGCAALARFRHVTLPSIADVIAITLMLSTIWTFNSFNTVFILTGGGPANHTQILPTLAYQYGLQRSELGQGAAVIVSVLPFFLGLIVLLTRRMLREKGVR